MPMALMSSSPASSTPRPLSKPTLPTPMVIAIIGFIPWGTLAAYIFPWVDVNVGQRRSDEPPPWTPWLEGWFQAINPWTWTVLEQDDSRDQQAWYIFHDVEEKLLAKVEEGGEEREELDRVSREKKRLVDRLADRCGKLYGLFLLRQAFLVHQRALHPLVREADLLPKESTSEDVELRCPFPPGSVWPLPVPHPLGQECTCNLHVYNGAEPVHFFRLPDIPSLEATQLGVALFGYDPSSAPLPPLAPPPPSIHATSRTPSAQVSAGIVASSWSWATRKLGNAVGVH